MHPALLLLSLSLAETPAGLTKTFGHAPSVIRHPSSTVVQFHESASHQEGHSCDGDFAWAFYYDGAGQLQSATWNPERALPTSNLFPSKERELHSTESGGLKAAVLVRRLPGDRILIASVNGPDQAEPGQAVLMRSGSVGRFYPWLAAKLKSTKPSK